MLKNLFRRKQKAKKDIFQQDETNLKNIDVLEEHEFLVALMYKSDAVDTIYPACASCYGISEEKNKKYEQRLGYIGRRVKSHHTSILEHSNVVIQVFVPLKNTENLFNTVMKFNDNIKPELCDMSTTDKDIMTTISEVRDVCRYLTIVTDTIKDNDNNPILRMTIGGSIRGFRYIFEMIENRQNKLFISIFNVLKLVIEPEFFIDFINDGVMEQYSTIEITKDLINNIRLGLLLNTTSSNINIINMDNLDIISNILKLDKEKCFDFVTITTEFKNMSRIITQQVTRHRNAITQESQRYVNYTGSSVNSPAKFKDKYDPKKEYETSLGTLTFEELGNYLVGFYEDLVEQGVDKEDARGYLPQNVQCGKLFMTFTLRSLFVFLNLRLDQHAQAEVNMYAHKLSELTKMYADSLFEIHQTMDEAAEMYSKPVYKRYLYTFKNQYEGIDEEV